MTDKPVALLLSPVLPQPGGSGRALRAWAWLQELQRDYRVHVLLPLSPDALPPLSTNYPAESVLAIGAAIKQAGRWRRLLAMLLPIGVLWSRRGVVDWLAWDAYAVQGLTGSLDGQSVQRIVVFRLYLHDLAQVLAARFPQPQMELDLDDLESRTRLSVAGALLRMGRYREAVFVCASAVQYALMQMFLPGDYRSVYLAAEEDCQRLRTRLAGRVACRPNTIAVPQQTVALARSKEICLLFVGTLNYPPNEEAVRYLLDQVQPELHKSGLRWCLRIVGRHAAPELVSLLRTSARVEFLPDVEELAACYASADIVLVPLRAGGGTKLKTLEGFAHCRPVISTAQGVRGLGAIAGEHYLAAQNARQFVAATLQLAANPALAERIAAAGRQLCQNRFGQA